MYLEELESLSSRLSVSLLFYSYIASSHISYSYSFAIIVLDFICIIAVILIYGRDFITCSSYFRLSVYMWGILLAYICCRLSSQLCFPVFWEAGLDI